MTEVFDHKGAAVVVGSMVVFGSPENEDEKIKQTGQVCSISDPDCDYDDETQRPQTYPPQIVVRFKDGDTEQASCYVLKWEYGMEEPTWTCDDIDVILPYE